jgi:hypothetical protein
MPRTDQGTRQWPLLRHLEAAKQGAPLQALAGRGPPTSRLPRIMPARRSPGRPGRHHSTLRPPLGRRPGLAPFYEEDQHPLVLQPGHPVCMRVEFLERVHAHGWHLQGDVLGGCSLESNRCGGCHAGDFTKGV